MKPDTSGTTLPGGMGFFERYLTLWVLLCIVAGIAVGRFAAGLATALQPITITALLATLVLLFSLKGDTIVANPRTILWIAIPLLVQTVKKLTNQRFVEFRTGKSVVSAKVGQARNRLGIVHFPFPFARYRFEERRIPRNAPAVSLLCRVCPASSPLHQYPGEPG